MVSQGWDCWCKSQGRHPKCTLQQVLKREPIAASPGRLGKIKMDGLHSAFLIHRFLVHRPGWGRRICISNKLGDADAHADAGLGTTL